MKIFSKTFHQLSNDELLAMYKLRSDVFVVEQICVYPDPDLTDKEAVHILGYEGEEFAAYARIYMNHTAHIGRVIVSENHRNKGLAKEIMQFAIDWLEQQSNHQKIEISAQVYLTNFYKKIGFEPIEKMYLEDGIPHLKMVYQL